MVFHNLSVVGVAPADAVQRDNPDSRRYLRMTEMLIVGDCKLPQIDR
jgi:hypothetical protein